MLDYSSNKANTAARRSALAHVTGTVSCQRPGGERDGEAARTSRTGKEGQSRDERFNAKWKSLGWNEMPRVPGSDASLVRLQQQMGLFLEKKRKKKI